ncbi:MAG TPA: lactonase family protein [Phnomibacter sp.]|nr:lactonase family protein [Phnomibacter sp.]
MIRKIAIAFLVGAIGFTGYAQESLTFYIGTYTKSGSYGIYVAQFNIGTGAIAITDSIAAENPSYLALNKAGNRIYAVTENGGDKIGGVSSYIKDEKSNKWKPLNATRIPSGGDHPCYISLNSKENFAMVSNYTGGSLSVLPIDDHGLVGEAVQVIQHRGSSINADRQASPHVHSAIFTPSEKYVVVADLGTDMVQAYPFDAKKKQPLDTTKVIGIKLPAGSGPRHMAFHPSKSLFYVVGEMSGDVSVYAFNKKAIAWLQRAQADSISKMPGSADIHVSADGRFLYASNRSDANNISVFSISKYDGKLSGVGQQSTLGKVPRNFAIDPTGKFLLAANQTTNNIVVFRLNETTGMPEPTGKSVQLPSPVCIVFAAR